MKDTHIPFERSIPEVYEKYLGPYLYEPFAQYVITRINGEAEKVLEIGVGSGRLTNHLVTKVNSQGKITALDINPNMLDVARKKVKATNVEFVLGDAQELPFPDNSFDLVICQFGFMFLPDKQKGFDEAWRVLKPRGQFLFVTWDRAENNITLHISQQTILQFLKTPPPPYFGKAYAAMNNPNDLRNYAKAAGFKQGDVEKITLEGKCTSAMNAAIGFVEGNSIVKEILKEGGPELLHTIETTITARINEQVGQDPICSELNAWLGAYYK